MDQLTQTAVAEIAKLAARTNAAIVQVPAPADAKGIPSTVPALLDPTSGKLADVSAVFAPWRTRPERKQGTAVAETLESFVQLVERHQTEHSVIFAVTDWRNPAFTAVIDYHGDDPDNGKHRVHYAFPLSEEWKAWQGINGKPLSQNEFAEFIEDHIAELAAPDSDEVKDLELLFKAKVAYPNELVVLSQGLQINAETRVKTAIKLQTGESQIVFEEDHKNANGDPITVPGVFVLNIAPFFQGESIRLPVRLRYRLRDGALSWTCMLYRPDIHITKAVTFALHETAAELGLPKFAGKPEMSA